MNNGVYKKRVSLLLILFGVWAVCAAGRLFYFSVLAREKYVNESNRLAWRAGTLPVVRGKILTADNIPLAWSEYQVRVRLKLFPTDSGRREAIFAFIQKHFGRSLTGEEKLPLTLVQMADMEQFQKLHKLARPYYELNCSIVMIRKRHPDKSLDGVIGYCRRREDGMLIGVSGLEKKYDKELCGQQGLFHVMLNRYGRFVKETMRIKREAIPGKDIKLDRTLESFQKERVK